MAQPEKKAKAKDEQKEKRPVKPGSSRRKSAAGLSSGSSKSEGGSRQGNAGHVGENEGSNR